MPFNWDELALSAPPDTTPSFVAALRRLPEFASREVLFTARAHPTNGNPTVHAEAHFARGRNTKELRTYWECAYNPVFQHVSTTLTVQVDGGQERLSAKQSFTDLTSGLMPTHSKGEEHWETILAVCHLLAPRLYEHDPRKGRLVQVDRELPSSPLFDPPGEGPLVPHLDTTCSICGSPLQSAFVVWGGGNLGFIHSLCCPAVGIEVVV
jgi:hypothetical protein